MFVRSIIIFCKCTDQLETYLISSDISNKPTSWTPRLFLFIVENIRMWKKVDLIWTGKYDVRSSLKVIYQILIIDKLNCFFHSYLNQRPPHVCPYVCIKLFISLYLRNKVERRGGYQYTFFKSIVWPVDTILSGAQLFCVNSQGLHNLYVIGRETV